ncbi:hypothetical protein Ddc_04333 [Ditylenchus destructor]|nr:hypothetical protein Ddc_04333 [Ditylenchus destructor]
MSRSAILHCTRATVSESELALQSQRSSGEPLLLTHFCRTQTQTSSGEADFAPNSRNDSIINAMEIVQTVRKSGTQLLIVGVNQTDTSPTNYFYKLTENVKLYSGYDLPSIGLSSWIFDLANSTKVSLQKSKPFIREDAPKSVLSAIGTPCSANVFKSDMDVEILVDETISSDDLGDLGTYLADVLSGLHLDGNTINSSCVGIVGYETENLDKILPLKDCAPYDKIFEALINLESSSVDSDGTSNLLNALNTSLTDFLDQKSNQSKHKLLIVAARSYSTTDLSTIISTAEQLKLNDVFIVTLDYSSGSESNTEQKSETKKASTALASASTAALVLFSESPKSYDSAKILLTETDHASNSPSIGEVLATISSEEQVYSKNDTDLVDLLTSALAYTNCQCPKNSTQLSVMDPKTNHKALFADCFYPVMDVSTAYSAEKECESMGGTLISFTNRLKFDFVQGLFFEIIQMSTKD